jgi:hypothetical protein
MHVIELLLTPQFHLPGLIPAIATENNGVDEGYQVDTIANSLFESRIAISMANSRSLNNSRIV